MSKENKEKLRRVGVENLLLKRKDFFDSFFKKGAEFATELISELESLRKNAAMLNEENLALRHQLASDDAIRDLLTKIETLETEKNSLQGRAESAIEKKEDYAGRYSEVEQELDTMASLYVALYQLHATLAPQEVLGVIEQLLAQFIGAGSFVIYLQRTPKGNKTLEPVYAYHCDDLPGKQVAWDEGPIGEAASTQVHAVADPSSRKPGEPLACIPMVLSGETIGVIAIMDFFEQKKEFIDTDFEFFKLLAVHSASAIVGSGLMARAEGISSSLESYQYL